MVPSAQIVLHFATQNAYTIDIGLILNISIKSGFFVFVRFAEHFVYKMYIKYNQKLKPTFLNILFYKM